MRRLFARLFVLTAVLLPAPAVLAEDLALVIANTQYRNYPADPNASAILDLAPRLRDAGFRTIVVRNLDSDALDRRLADLAGQLIEADRVIVVTSGYYAHRAGESWLVTTDADRPGPFNIGRHGLWFQALYDIAASKQGDALIAVAIPERDPDIGPRLEAGFRPGEIPQGLTLVVGRGLQIGGFLTRDLLVPGRPIGVAAQNAPRGLQVLGYVPDSRAFLPAGAEPDRPDVSEEGFWLRTRRIDTAAAYERYLEQYPDGRYRREARTRLLELNLSPQDRAQAAEDALRLDRQQRSRLQEFLTVLGHDTRGIDGVFGPNTRSAVRDWQQQVGAEATGFLTANQVARLEIDGAERAEELRRQAEERRRERERRDRSYWEETGASGNADGLRAYLERYPDGLFAAEAERELARIERDLRRAAEREERDAWQRAAEMGTVDSYRAYLEAYPRGMFAAEAQARIRNLSEPETDPAVVAAARAEESALNLDPFRMRLVETQLDKLGLEPGRIDGRFDADTRRAIRRFQRSNEMPVTGYVTRDTVVRLLVSAIR